MPVDSLKINWHSHEPWYSQVMSMKHPDQKLGRTALIVGGLFVAACGVLVIVAMVVN